MKSSVQSACLSVLLASLVTVCVCRPGWRPQGRFGKRLSPALSDPESGAGSEFDVSALADVPVEFLYTKEELESAGAKPHLCSISGLREYPRCNFQFSSGVQSDSELLRALLGTR
ncbi:hypothetical protein EGW08_018899 [Elysia chlorotica]|uniref:Selenoprotein F/M domain-containing protein n=1 Tax=Elysia chlorotica TaxID=188477 RepID=A0A3S1AVI9_ELYCH|nr:hypothetical protein EGW08_018899 [Elysia chlorotica]